MVDNDTLIEFWDAVKQYIPAKDRQAAADQAVEVLSDADVDDKLLKELAASDSYMRDAVAEHVELDEEEDE